MPTYIGLAQYTPEGIETLRAFTENEFESIARALPQRMRSARRDAALSQG